MHRNTATIIRYEVIQEGMPIKYLPRGSSNKNWPYQRKWNVRGLTYLMTDLCGGWVSGFSLPIHIIFYSSFYLRSLDGRYEVITWKFGWKSPLLLHCMYLVCFFVCCWKLSLVQLGLVMGPIFTQNNTIGNSAYSWFHSWPLVLLKGLPFNCRDGILSGSDSRWVSEPFSICFFCTLTGFFLVGTVMVEGCIICSQNLVKLVVKFVV